MQQRKQSNDDLPLENFYLCIIYSIKSDNKLPSPASLNTTKQRINYYVKKLKKANIIRKIGYGVWELNTDELERNQFLAKIKEVKEVKKSLAVGRDQVKILTSSGGGIRGHGFVITLKIPKIPGWYKRDEFLRKNNIDYIPIGSNWKGQRIMFKGHKTWLTDRSIVIYTPKGKSYFADSAEESRTFAVYDIIELIKGLERLFMISLRKGKDYAFKVSRSHYGKINDSLANQYRRDGKLLKVINKDGLWLVSDYSFNNDELETVSPKSSMGDMDCVIIPMLNDLKEHYDKTGESVTFSGVLNVVDGLASAHALYAENIKSHIHAIKTIDKNIIRMTDIMEKIEGQLIK